MDRYRESIADQQLGLSMIEGEKADADGNRQVACRSKIMPRRHPCVVCLTFKVRWLNGVH